LLVYRCCEQIRAFIAKLDRIVKAEGFQALGVKAELTGRAPVGYGEMDSVVRQIVAGFLLAFAAIVALQWLVLRSLRLALVSMVPNVLPIMACFLALRVFDIHLRLESALVLCISIGGLFNTTIHFSARVLQRRRELQEPPHAVILHALQAVAPPSLFTAVTLSAGFAVFLLSSFPGLRALGLLSMVTLLTAFVADVLVTPVLVYLVLDWDRPMTSGLPWRPTLSVGSSAPAASDQATL